MPDDPLNAEVYVQKYVTINELLAVTWKFTAIFNEKSSISFSKWCASRKVLFTKKELVKKTRRLNGPNGRVNVRLLYILKDEFLGKMQK